MRNAYTRRFAVVKEQTRAKNRIQRWISIYFPEYKGIYTLIDSKGGLMVLKKVAIPDEIAKLGVDGIIQIWKKEKLRANGRSKAMEIVNAAVNSIGLKEGLESARMEIRDLIEDYERHTKRLE